MTPTTTTAEPTIEVRVDQRKIQARWPIGERYQRHGEECQDAVVLTCTHNSHRRGFTAVLRIETELYRDGRHVGTTFMVFADSIRLPGEPIVRYSAKRLQTFFDATLDAVTTARARGEYGRAVRPSRRRRGGVVVAITDQQLDELHGYARAAARRLPDDADDTTVLHAIFDAAAGDGMRTQDEFAAPVTLEDLPAIEDHRDLLATFHDQPFEDA